MQVNSSAHKQTWMNKSRIHIEHKWTQENMSSLRTRECKWTWIKFDWKGSLNEYQPNKEWRLETIAKLKERTCDSSFPWDYHNIYIVDRGLLLSSYFMKTHPILPTAPFSNFSNFFNFHLSTRRTLLFVLCNKVSRLTRSDT